MNQHAIPHLLIPNTIDFITIFFSLLLLPQKSEKCAAFGQKSSKIPIFFTEGLKICFCTYIINANKKFKKSVFLVHPILYARAWSAWIGKGWQLKGAETWLDLPSPSSVSWICSSMYILKVTHNQSLLYNNNKNI